MYLFKNCYLSYNVWQTRDLPTYGLPVCTMVQGILIWELGFTFCVFSKVIITVFITIIPFTIIILWNKLNWNIYKRRLTILHYSRISSLSSNQLKFFLCDLRRLATICINATFTVSSVDFFSYLFEFILGIQDCLKVSGKVKKVSICIYVLGFSFA